MKFYLAEQIENKPYVIWHFWAESIEVLTEMGEYDNPLIVGADYLPPFEFNVCPLKVVGGELVERDGSEMAAFETEYELYQKLTGEVVKIKDFNSARLLFDDHAYPMHESARLRYTAAAMSIPVGKTKFLDCQGEWVTILADDIPDFFDAYCKKVLSMTDYIEPLDP